MAIEGMDEWVKEETKVADKMRRELGRLCRCCQGSHLLYRISSHLLQHPRALGRIEGGSRPDLTCQERTMTSLEPPSILPGGRVTLVEPADQFASLARLIKLAKHREC